MRLCLLLASFLVAGCSQPTEKPKTDQAAEPKNPKSNEDAITAFRRGQAFEKNGEPDKAIAEYSEAIKLNPRLAQPYNNRGKLRLDKGELDKAMTDLDEAIRLAPKASMVPYVNRGNTWRKKKEYDKAIADFSTAIELDPKRYEPWNGRGNAWCEKKEYHKGIKDFDETIRLNPAFADAYSTRGAAWFDLKDYGKAIADWKETLEHDPGDHFTMAQFAQLLAAAPDEKLRDGKRARAIAQKALDRKETPSGLEAMAAACAETGDFDEAVRWQRKAIDHPKLADRGARDRLALYENKKPFRLD